MNKKLTIRAIVAVMAALGFFAGGLAQAADFSLFTTQDDDFVTCNAGRGAPHLHIAATNFDPDENRINIVFADADLVTVRVPTGESFSLAQVIGTNRHIDDVIRIDPLDQDGDVNPMVGWVSIHPHGSCDVTSLP